MANPTDRFNLGESILKATKIGLIRLSVCSSVFTVRRNNNQFPYDSVVLDIF